MLLGETREGASAEQREQLHLQLGRAYEFVNDWERASATYNALLALARESRRPARECDALNRLATVRAQGSFDLAGAMGLLAQAQEAAERSGDQLRLAETSWNQAQLTFYAWRLEDSLAFGERALALSRELGNQDLRARCLNIVAYNHLMIGHIAETERYAAEARAVAIALGNRAMEVDCLSIVSILRVWSGNVPAGIEAAKAGIDLGRAVENPWGIANCTYPLAQGKLDFGDVGQALAIMQEGVAAARIASHPPTLVFNLLALGRIYRAVFAIDEARQLHHEALAIAEMLHHPFLTEWSLVELATDHAFVDEWAEAAHLTRRAIDLRHYGRVYVGFARWCDTEALVRTDLEYLALQDIGQARQHQQSFPRGVFQLHRCDAVLAEAHNDLPTAIGHLTNAVTLARDLGLVHEHWQTAVALGDALHRHGDDPSSHQAYREAATIVQQIAAQIPDPPLQESFLAAPSVQRALAHA
jgi:tetratricopeptide (TPR) repeat protein